MTFGGTLGVQSEIVSKWDAWIEDMLSQPATDDCIYAPFQVHGDRPMTNRAGHMIPISHLVLIRSGQPRPIIDGYHGAVAKHSCDHGQCLNLRHLSWGTQTENMAERGARGRTSKRASHYAARLSEDDVETIRLMRRGGATLQQIGDVVGVTRQHVHNILSGKNWVS